jgi:hypothetical protein
MAQQYSSPRRKRMDPSERAAEHSDTQRRLKQEAADRREAAERRDADTPAKKKHRRG